MKFFPPAGFYEILVWDLYYGCPNIHHLYNKHREGHRSSAKPQEYRDCVILPALISGDRYEPERTQKEELRSPGVFVLPSGVASILIETGEVIHDKKTYELPLANNRGLDGDLQTSLY